MFPDRAAVCDASGDPRLDGPRAHGPAAAVAFGARVVNHHAAALAGLAGLGEPEAAEVPVEKQQAEAAETPVAEQQAEAVEAPVEKQQAEAAEGPAKDQVEEKKQEPEAEITSIETDTEFHKVGKTTEVGAATATDTNDNTEA